MRCAVAATVDIDIGIPPLLDLSTLPMLTVQAQVLWWVVGVHRWTVRSQQSFNATISSAHAFVFVLHALSEPHMAQQHGHMHMAAVRSMLFHAFSLLSNIFHFLSYSVVYKIVLYVHCLNITISHHAPAFALDDGSVLIAGRMTIPPRAPLFLPLS